MADLDAQALSGFVTEGDHLWDERADVNGRFGELYKRVKDAGLNVGTFRQILSERRMDRDALQTRLERLNQYRVTLGMFADTPLGAAAVEREAGPTVSDRRTAAAAESLNSQKARKPRAFAEQPLHRGRGRRRRDPPGDDALARARAHLADAQGSA